MRGSWERGLQKYDVYTIKRLTPTKGEQYTSSMAYLTTEGIVLTQRELETAMHGRCEDHWTIISFHAQRGRNHIIAYTSPRRKELQWENSQTQPESMLGPRLA